MMQSAACRQIRQSWRHTGSRSNRRNAVNTGFHGYFSCGLHRSARIKDDVKIDLGTGTGDLNAKVFDFVSMSEERYWLISRDGAWGYADHDGNVQAMYEDAAAFQNGYALIVENGMAYLINEQFEVLGEVREADSVYQAGEIFVVRHEGRQYLYRIGD